jgi:hypothetical protein
MPLLTELIACTFRYYKDLAPTEPGDRRPTFPLATSDKSRLNYALAFHPLTFAPLRLCVRFFLRLFLRSLRSFLTDLALATSVAAIPSWLSAIREALFPNSEHGQLFLIDQRAGHRDRSVAEQEQG